MKNRYDYFVEYDFMLYRDIELDLKKKKILKKVKNQKLRKKINKKTKDSKNKQ